MSLNRDAIDTFEDIVVVTGSPDPPRFDFSPDFISPFPSGDGGGIAPLPTPAPEPEVIVSAPRPTPQPDDWFTWRGQSGPRDVWTSLFNQRPDIGREVIEDLRREEELEWDRALAKAKGDEVKARQIFRKALLKAGYLASEIDAVINRVSGSLLRAATTVAPTITEVVIQAARTPAARVATSGPLGLATLVLEGAYRLGGFLSQDALRRRLPPPPVATAPPPAPKRPPKRPAPQPTTLPQLPQAPIQTVTISAPRPTPRSPIDSFLRNPLFDNLRNPFANFGTSPTEFGTSPTERLRQFAPESPSNLTGTRFRNVPSLAEGPRSAPGVPTSFGLQGCAPQSNRKKRKKKPRDVCYRGEYVERRNGLTKFRERKIPCK